MAERVPEVEPTGCVMWLIAIALLMLPGAIYTVAKSIDRASSLWLCIEAAKAGVEAKSCK